MTDSSKPWQPRAITEEQARQKLEAQCARTEYCLSDIRRKMQRWALTEAEKKRITEQLLKDRFVDEERYARAFVRDKFRFNRWGMVKIELELRRRGISQDVIDVAKEEVSDEDRTATLKRLLEEKAKTITAKTDYERMGKLYRFALSKGYTYDEISQILD